MDGWESEGRKTETREDENKGDASEFMDRTTVVGRKRHAFWIRKEVFMGVANNPKRRDAGWAMPGMANKIHIFSDANRTGPF